MTLVERLRLASPTTSIFAFSVRIVLSSRLPFLCASVRFFASAFFPPSRSRKADSTATERNGRKTLTTVQGLPKKFDQKKILKVIKKKFACNGTVVADTEMGEVIQLQGDQRKDVQDFLTDKKEGLGLDTKTIKVHGF